MQNLDFEHPTDDALERYLLNQSPAEELEVVETHTLACDSCVSRLEALEVEIATFKLALQKVESERREKAAAKAQSRSRSWFSVPNLSWAAAAAALLIGISIVPHYTSRDVTLSAYRGVESTVVPAGHRLHMHLNAADLAQGPVTVEVVNADGNELWKGTSAIQHDQVEVTVPQIAQNGAYFVRLYAPSQSKPEGDLLREFAFDVQ